MGQVSGKVAFITGGAAGIGAACAKALASEGAAVAISDVNDAAGQATVAAINSSGGKALYIHQDVTDEGAWQGVVDTIVAKFGKLDIAVANAGIAIFGSALQMTLADFRRQNAVNIDGVFLTAKYCIPAMRKAGGGSLVMISSVAGLRGSANLAGYSASKGAVRLFAKSMAMECAAAGDNIRVNSVHPGIIVTDIWQKAATAAGGGLNAPLDPHALGLAAPIGKAAEPVEIANGVLFLASDASRYITGTELIIDGGMTAGTIRRN